MKLRVAVLPLIVFLAFGYSNTVLYRASDAGQTKLTVENVKVVVKADLAKFEPSNVVVYNK